MVIILLDLCLDETIWACEEKLFITGSTREDGY